MQLSVLAELQAIRHLLEALTSRLEPREPSVSDTLRRRGLVLKRLNPPERLLWGAAWSAELEADLYTQLKRNSFRIFLRDLIARGPARKEELARFCSPATVARYLAFLQNRGLVEDGGGRFRVRQAKVRSFGETLEWLVARILTEEFGAQAAWGVKLSGVRAGGDYDVLARLENALIYVEVKSSPPKHIHEREVAAFLDRVGELAPDLAVFFVDTELRMRDKIVPLFEGTLAKRADGTAPPVKRWLEECFHVGEGLLIANAKPSLVGSLGRCLRFFFGGPTRAFRRPASPPRGED